MSVDTFISEQKNTKARIFYQELYALVLTQVYNFGFPSHSGIEFLGIIDLKTIKQNTLSYKYFDIKV